MLYLLLRLVCDYITTLMHHAHVVVALSVCWRLL